LLALTSEKVKVNVGAAATAMANVRTSNTPRTDLFTGFFS
jgi:hypothetical protein